MAHGATIVSRTGRSLPLSGRVPRIHHLPALNLAEVSVLVAVLSLTWAVLPAFSFPSVPDPQPTAAPHDEVWIATSTTAQTLGELDRAIAEAFLGSSTSFALGGWGSSAPAVSWASEEAFEADLEAGRIPPEVRVVMYDPESWDATPLFERLDPVAAMRSFGLLARQHGYLVVITPHPNLVTVPDATCTVEDGESLEQAFLRCGIQGAAASYGDVVEVQAQHLETDPLVYGAFVRAAAAQARAANPGVLVLSGLSTNFTSDPSVLFAAWESVLGIVDGHYLNVPHGRRPETAVGFLQQVAAVA